jgi:ribosome-associated heat shock protein Hsp15
MREKEPGAQASVRLDRWLWAARFYKTRSLAAQACWAGKVRANGQPAKPHKPVRAGDVVSLPGASGWGGRREFAVAALAERRGPASQARLLYEPRSGDTPPSAAEGEGAFFLPLWPAPAGERSRRPTKRDRRRIDRLRGR